LTFSDGTPLVEPQVVASGMPMEEPIRFVACVVEHSRSNDAEFQVLNKAAEASPHGGTWGVWVDHRSKVVILHWVCLKMWGLCSNGNFDKENDDNPCEYWGYHDILRHTCMRC
jgi:hypothetical protein